MASSPVLSAPRLLSIMKVPGIVLALLAAGALAADRAIQQRRQSRDRRRRQRLHRRTHATRLHRQCPYRRPQRRLQHQHLRQDAMINLLVGRAQLEARVLTTCQRHGVLLTAAMVVVGTKARTGPSTIGLSMEWRPLLLAVVVVAAPQ